MELIGRIWTRLPQSWWRRCGECRTPGKRSERKEKHLRTNTKMFQKIQTENCLFFLPSCVAWIFTSVREEVGVDAPESGLVDRSSWAFLHIENVTEITWSFFGFFSSSSPSWKYPRKEKNGTQNSWKVQTGTSRRQFQMTQSFTVGWTHKHSLGQTKKEILRSWN